MRDMQRVGFTLIETVFAIFVFAVGALGLAATIAGISRSLAGSSIRERASRVASARIETLRGLSCGLIGSGTESVQGASSVWTATAIAGHATVSVAVTYLAGGRPHTDSYNAAFRCLP